MTDPNWAAIATFGVVLITTVVGVVVWLVRLEGKAASAKDRADAAVAAAKEAVAVAAANVKEEAVALKDAAAITAANVKEEANKLAARVALCEHGHEKTAGEMSELRLDIAVLRERSDTTIKTLERIESAVTQRTASAPRTRATKS